MRIRLRGSSITPEQQRANDCRTRVGVIAAFFLLILAYSYLFTHASLVYGLPLPQQLAETLGISLDRVFDRDGNVSGYLFTPGASRVNKDDACLTVFAVLLGAFLCGYFLPLKWKRPSYVLFFLLGFLLIYGLPVTATLAAAHLGVYLLFHPSSPDTPSASFACGGLVSYLLFRECNSLPPGALVNIVAISGGLFVVGYRYLVRPFLLKDRQTISLLRFAAVQIPILGIYYGMCVERIHGRPLVASLGVLVFFFQWARLMVYHADYKSGQVPKDLGSMEYLSVFLSPAVILNCAEAPYVGQGYSYLSENFLCRDKNKIILSGLYLWSVALVYFVFGDWFVANFKHLMHRCFDIPVYEFIGPMVRDYANGKPMSTATVLFSTLLDQGRIYIVFGAITHFRVGSWRVLGYQMDPQYNRPWLATNLVALWSRFAFHFREFLVRVFYYPVFFRFFKAKPALRVFTAIMVATIIGNAFWLHTPEKMYTSALTWDNFFRLILRSWPYYILLGSGIALTQLFLMRRVRMRRPWTLDRWFPVDVLCSYLTFQYFSLIHIFIRPQENSALWDHVRLFMIGFGIHL